MTGPTVPVICLHGPESVGKSVLADQLARHFQAELVPEYGRDYCAARGTDLDMRDLLHIAQIQAQWIAAARARARQFVIADTDPLMTAVWADMMHGQRNGWFDAWQDTADLYLLLDIDLPFIDDGLRIYGGEGERGRFFDLCKAELVRRKVPWRLVSGVGEARLASALAAISDGLGSDGLGSDGLGTPG